MVACALWTARRLIHLWFLQNVLKADLSQSLPAEEHLLRLIYSCSFGLSSKVNEHGAFKGGLLLDERFLSSTLSFQSNAVLVRFFSLTFPGVTTFCFLCSCFLLCVAALCQLMCCFVSFCPDHYLTSTKLFANIKSLLCCSFKSGYCMSKCKSKSNYA